MVFYPLLVEFSATMVEAGVVADVDAGVHIDIVVEVDAKVDLDVDGIEEHKDPLIVEHIPFLQ